jgi:hypothetical protein
MKKYLVLIATVSFAVGACERHPASQLSKEDEGVGKEGSETTQEKQTTPKPSPSGTPKTYFPQNS